MQKKKKKLFDLEIQTQGQLYKTNYILYFVLIIKLKNIITKYNKNIYKIKYSK